MRNFLAPLAVALLLSGTGAAIAGNPPAAKTTHASARHCRDAKGKFVACPRHAVKHCRDANGKFTACKA